MEPKSFFKLIVGAWLAGALLSVAHADTAVITESNETFGAITKTTLYWTTSTNLNSVSSSTNKHVRGELLRVSFLGTTATNAYDVTMKDGLGVDILGGLGTSIPSNTVTTVVPALFRVGTVGTIVTTNLAPVYVNDQVTILVTNAGNNVSGKIVLWTR